MNELRGQTQRSPYNCSSAEWSPSRGEAVCVLRSCLSALSHALSRCVRQCSGVQKPFGTGATFRSTAEGREISEKVTRPPPCPGTSTPGDFNTGARRWQGAPAAARRRRRARREVPLRARRESSKGPAARGCGGARLVLHICSRVRRGTKPSRGTRPCAAQPCRRPPSARQTFGTSTPSAELGCQPQRTCARSPRCSSNASTPAERNCHEQQTALALQAPNLQIFLMRCLHTWTRPLGQ